MALVWRCLLQHTAGTLARSSHAIAVVGGTAYLFGGENVPRVPVDSHLYTMDLSQAESGAAAWKQLELKDGSPEPQARIAPAMAAIGETVWVFGGRMGVTMDESPLDELWAFDTAARTWDCVMESAQAKGGPSKRSFHQMMALEGKLYVFGGCGPEGRLHDLHAFDPATKTWEALPANEMRGRGGAAMTAVDGKIIVVAGFAGEETKDTWAFDVEKKAWEDWSAHSAATLIPRSVLGIAPLPGSDGNALVIFGGEVDPSSEGHMGAGGFAGDTLTFSLTDKTKGWTAPNLASDTAPSPRGWYAYTSVPSTGAFLVYGGLAPDNSRLGDLWALVPATDDKACSAVA